MLRGVTGNTTYLGPKRRENARNTNLRDEQLVHVLASAIKEATPHAVSGEQPKTIFEFVLPSIIAYIFPQKSHFLVEFVLVIGFLKFNFFCHFLLKTLT